MKIDWFTDVAAFERLESEWNLLLERAAINTLFLTREWQTTWWRHLGEGELRVMTFREEDGSLAGIAPLFAARTPDNTVSLSVIGCVDVSDYLDLIVARGCEEEVYGALLDTLMRPEFPAWDSLNLCTLPAASMANTLLMALAEGRGLRVERKLHDVAPGIELPDTFDAYLETLDKKQRHEVRRKLRRVEEANTRWYAITAADAVDAAIADFVELHKKSRPDKNLFMDVRMQSFFVDMVRQLFPLGWIQLAFLEVEGERAASILNFIYRHEVLVYNSGYDPVKYGNLSPGIVLFAHSIRDAIAAGHRRYDFLRGDEEYKYRFGATDSQVYELCISK